MQIESCVSVCIKNNQLYKMKDYLTHDACIVYRQIINTIELKEQQCVIRKVSGCSN